MDRNDYTSISNLKQLHQAQQKLKHTIEMKEYELKMETKACKEALNPITYINQFIDKLYSMEHLIKYFVKGYEFVKGLLSKENGNVNEGDVNEKKDNGNN